METKIQQILAKIPNSIEIVNEIKQAYHSGDINKEDEFLNIQKGLSHVTFRVDQIEELRLVYKLML